LGAQPPRDPDGDKAARLRKQTGGFASSATKWPIPGGFPVSVAGISGSQNPLGNWTLTMISVWLVK
jgi:hypothetical protein